MVGTTVPSSPMDPSSVVRKMFLLGLCCKKCSSAVVAPIINIWDTDLIFNSLCSHKIGAIPTPPPTRIGNESLSDVENIFPRGPKMLMDWPGRNSESIFVPFPNNL